MNTTHPSAAKFEARFKLLQARLDVLAAKAESVHVDLEAEQANHVEAGE